MSSFKIAVSREYRRSDQIGERPRRRHEALAGHREPRRDPHAEITIVERGRFLGPRVHPEKVSVPSPVSQGAFDPAQVGLNSAATYELPTTSAVESDMLDRDSSPDAQAVEAVESVQPEP